MIADLEKKIDIIRNIDPKWEEHIYTNKASEELVEAWEKVEDLYFEDAKTVAEDEDKLKRFKQRVNKALGEKAYAELEGRIAPQIELFSGMLPLKKINDKARFISRCIEDTVIRRDDDFFSECAREFGLSVEEVVLVTDTLENIIMNHTIQELSKKTARTEFKKLTDLDDMVCMLYAEKYDVYYEKLQMKLLIVSNRYLENKVARLSKELADLKSNS